MELYVQQFYAELSAQAQASLGGAATTAAQQQYPGYPPAAQGYPSSAPVPGAPTSAAISSSTAAPYPSAPSSYANDPYGYGAQAAQAGGAADPWAAYYAQQGYYPQQRY
jgi:hypothetical protein